MKILTYFMLLTFCVELSFNKMQKVIRVDRLEACVEPPTSSIHVQGLEIINANHCSYLKASLEVIRDVKRIQLAAKIFRCANKETLDSCAYFTTLRKRDVCPLLKLNGTIISPMIYACDPPAICPFRKGQYKIINGHFDPNMMQFIPFDKWYWKMEFDMHNTDTNEFLVRLCIDGQVVTNYS